MITLLHNKTRKMLIDTWDKIYNAKEVVEYFSAGTSAVYHLETDAGNWFCGVQSLFAQIQICFQPDKYLKYRLVNTDTAGYYES